RLYGGVVVATTDEALDGEHGILGVRDGLTTGDLTDQPLAALRERHHGGGDAATLGVRDDDGVAPFHHGDARVRGPQIDSDDFRHLTVSSVGALITTLGVGKV